MDSPTDASKLMKDATGLEGKRELTTHTFWSTVDRFPGKPDVCFLEGFNLQKKPQLLVFYKCYKHIYELEMSMK